MRTMFAKIFGLCMGLSMGLWMAGGGAQTRTPACTPVAVESGHAHSRATVVRTATACIRYLPQPAESAPDAPLDVLVFGDPQPKSAVDAGYFRRDIVEPLLGRQHAALGLSLGDIVDDAPDVYPLVRAATAELGVPWMYLPGNHDVDAGATDDATSLREFHRAFGADTHARETASATFIALDDVIAMPGSKPAYIGGFREDQFAFLEAYLPTLRKDRLLVLAMHIPLFEKNGKDSFRDADRARLFALLRDFPHLLVLSAHSHSQQHVFHDAKDGWNGPRPLHEYNVGAACGSYWSGVKDAQGIPDATMADGTPNGYAMLTVQPGGTYALAWHNARDAADTQIGVHAPKVLRRGAYPAWGVYANVYMGKDDSRE
jgi:3',5'-cyclic AMP phosphodiesterase CpdA